ncbi:ATP-grasp domain-containing protein [Streptomyces sp. NPDC055239]
MCFLRSLDGRAELFAGDVDANGVGLYLVDREHRRLLPRGDDPVFADALLKLCRELAIDVLVPTVDTELTPLARRAADFADEGVRVLTSTPEALESCLDKWRLAEACAGVVRVPVTALVTDDGPGADFAGGYPAIAKPRRGSGSRGVHTVQGPRDLAGLAHDGSQLVQEMLPGTEYSVDVLIRPDGQVAAAVPRSRDKTDSGIVVAGRVVDAPEFSTLAAAVVRALGLRGIANVQVREDRAGRPALLEVNPRPPGGMSLTIASGVHMPAFAVAGLLGLDVPAHIPHREIAVVRHWQDIVLPAGGLGEVGGTV